MLSTCYLELNDFDNARKYAELAAFAGVVARAEPLYFLALHLRRHGQYKLAYYYAILAAKVPKPDVGKALFISYTIYDYWVDYELAVLYRHVFPSQHSEGMRIALTFWNNVYAPQDLRESFASLMKAYVRPIIASASDEKYRYQTEGAEWPLAMFSGKNHVHLLLPRANGGVELSVLDVDTRTNSVSDHSIVLLHLETVPSKHAMSDIIWQFEGPNCVIGFLASESYVYHWEWSAESDAQVYLRSLLIDWQATQQAPPWSVVKQSGVVYCISKWYPTIEVGECEISSSSAACITHTSHSQVPRAFSFFSATTNGVAYRGDIWFLLRVDPLDAFVMVVLRPDFTLKAFTPPFTREADEMTELDENKGKEGPFSYDIVTGDDGQDHVVYAYTSGMDVVISRIQMEEVLAWMI
jgi:hypothetical protein